MATVNPQGIPRGPQEMGKINISERWTNLESLITEIRMQCEQGSVQPIVDIQPAETIPNNGQISFQLTPDDPFGIYDMENANMILRTERRIRVECQGSTDGATWTNKAVPAGTKIFMGEKHAANIIKNLTITAASTDIYTSDDFVFETNLIRAQYTDEATKRNPNTVTFSDSVNATSANVCGTYRDLSGLGTATGGRDLVVEYDMVIPMATFNILATMRWMVNFFGLWTMRINPTAENMVFKVVSERRPTTPAGQFSGLPYHIDSEIFHPGDGTWFYLKDNVIVAPVTEIFRIRFFAESTQRIMSARIRTLAARLRNDKYMALVQDFFSKPLKIPYNTIVAHPGVGLEPTPGTKRPINVVIKQTANNIDSIFMTFHRKDSRNGSICVQPFIKKIRITTNGRTFPSNIDIDTYNNHTQRSMLHDAFNIQNNFAVSLNKDFDHSITPYFTVPYINTLGTLWTDRTYLRTGDITNCIVAIPHALDGSHNEGLFSSGGNFSWLIEGEADPNMYLYSNTDEVTAVNQFQPRRIVVTCVCDTTLELFSNVSNTPGQVRNAPVNRFYNE